VTEQITIIIDRHGKSTIKVHGAAGARCLALTDNLEKEIGQRLERQKTSEFYQSSPIHVKNRIRHQKIRE